MAKQIFVVKVCWKVYGEIRTEAETAEEAAEYIAHNEIIPEMETGQDDYQVLDVIPASDPMEDGEDLPI